MTQAESDAWIEQWELTNQWLDQVEGSEKEKTFDLMLAAAVELGRGGYRLNDYPGET
jgi:hypothetical protein